MNQFDFINYFVQRNYIRCGIDGRSGAGKTNLAIYLIKELKKQTKRKVYSNIWLSFKHYKVTKEMIKTLPDELNNSILLIDEIHIWGADSYKFLSTQAEFLTLLFTQLRKRNILLIYTTQSFQGQINKRLRKNTDMIFHCTSIEYLNHPLLPKNKRGEILVTSAVEVHFVDEFTGDEYEQSVSTFLFDGKPYWKNYDTYEVVT